MVVPLNQPNGTDFVHAAVTADPTTGAMLTSICQSTAFKQHSVERYQESGFTYSRSANPTVTVFEQKIASLEGAKFPGIVFGTGMAATNCLMCSFLRSGDHVLVTRCSYGGTNRAARVLYARQFGIEFDFVDMTDLESVRKAIRPGQTRMVISETPCNPTLQLADLQGISQLVKEMRNPNPRKLVENLQAGEGPSWQSLEGRIIHVADCTLAPPAMMRGLDFGVDVVLISLTKFYDGLNMHLGGAMVTNDSDLYEHIRFKQNVMGSIMSPATAFSMLQSTKTLHLRMERQCFNAMKIAEYLESHPKVESVNYPGLPSHPQHQLALKQHRPNMHGSLVALEIRGGSEAGRRVMNACVAPWTLAENLGATESIMTCPSVFTHGNMPRETRLSVGITDGLIRLSVGIEDVDDLIVSLGKALEAA